MAKNIFQSKKRVSHFQKTLEGENELFGCKDYVSSIIQDMDSNFSCIQSGYSKKSTECNETQFTSPEDSFLNIPVLKMPSSSSNGTLQIPAKSSNSKKYSLSRKFPLMEKSQKILKQLKHNQNVPKPRAHVAGILKSPSRNKAKYMSRKISVAKKKEIRNVKNKTVSSTCTKVPPNHSPILNIKNSNLSKISKDSLAAKLSKSKKTDDTSGKDSYRDIPASSDFNKDSKSKKIEADTSGKDSYKDIPAISDLNKYSKSKKIEDNTHRTDSHKDTPMISDSNIEANSILEYDSGTSDSEYERFVKKSKKGLRRKSSKRAKQNSKKRKSCTTGNKRKKSAQVSEQKDTNDCGNFTESSRNSKISTCKKQKIVHDNTYFKNDSDCSDHDDVLDEPIRDSSSERDDDVAASKTPQMTSKTSEVRPVGETSVISIGNSSLSTPKLGGSESVINSASSNDEAQITNSVQLEVNHTNEKEISSDVNLHQTYQNILVSESNTNYVKVKRKFLNENNVNSHKIEQDNLPLKFVIDLCVSDDECGSDELNASKLSSENVLPTSIENSTKILADSFSEESDIEIIEEVNKSVQTMDKCSTSVLTNTPNFSENLVASDKCSDGENLSVNVKPAIKNEVLDNESFNTLPVVKKEKRAEIDDKHDVVYRTDICHTKVILEQRAEISSHCSKNPNVPSEVFLQGESDLAVVKHEISSDDEIVILDSVHLPSAKLENIKSESSTSESKLNATIDFEPKIDKTKEWADKFKDAIPVSSAKLLEWYKMEYDTYVEMKQANADVEASLKNLQARQAQKMRYVRNLVLQCINSNQDDKSQVDPSKDCKDFISVDVQNNPIAPNNSFPPNSQIVSPSTTVQDLKPDVDKLQEGIQPAAIKPKVESIEDDLNTKKSIPKVESDGKQTLRLLDEKCSVCGKDAVAACQRCAKVFFCSHECGRKFWIDGHVKVCGTK